MGRPPTTVGLSIHAMLSATFDATKRERDYNLMYSSVVLVARCVSDLRYVLYIYTGDVIVDLMRWT